MSSGISRLLVPAQLYAAHAEAARAAGRFVTAVKKGTPVRDAGGPLIEVSDDRPGLLVLDGPRTGLPATGSQFHLNLPWRRLATSLDDADTFERTSREALDDAWAFVALAGSQYHQVVKTAVKQLRLLDAARRHWATVTSVGPRYSQGSGTGQSLETLPTLVRFALVRQGATWHGQEPLTVARLDHELDALPGFRVHAALERGDVAAATELLAGRNEVTLVSLAEHFLAFDLDHEACRAVERHVVEDPHGIVRDWLAGRGDRTRTVR